MEWDRLKLKLFRSRLGLLFLFVIVTIYFLSFIYYDNEENNNGKFALKVLTSELNRKQEKKTKYFTSFCSSEADDRGPHQHVVALSLYGNFSDPLHFSRYVDPSLKIILSNFTQNYPGYSPFFLIYSYQ
jgi:hypothetical protein